jgi:hypothetical protein
MIWIDYGCELVTQRLNLIIVKQTDTGEIAVGVEEIDLIGGEPVLIPGGRNGWLVKQSGNRFVMFCRSPDLRVVSRVGRVRPLSRGSSEPVCLRRWY